MSTQTKPIVVIKIDTNTDLGNGKPIMQNLKMMQEGMQNKFTDYYVLALPKYYPNDNEPISLQVFYDKDFTETNLEELRAMVKQSIEQKPEPNY